MMKNCQKEQLKDVGYYISFDCNDVYDKSEYIKINTNSISEKKVEIENSTIETLTREIRGFRDEVKEQLADHDNKVAGDHQLLLDELKNLKLENQYFRHELSKIYNPDRLKKKSLYIALGALSSIALSVFASIDIIHPIASYSILFAAIIFHIMSLIMNKQDSEG